MYATFFGLSQAPFSLAPDPRYLFMSERHREALAHLLYGLQGSGGFVLLTGDIGTGKTTICRRFLEHAPEHCRIAYVFNPRLTVPDLLATICQEFQIEVASVDPSAATVRHYLEPLNRFLLAGHARGLNSVLVIDEAQNLSSEVLEQLRLLTNLETSERKLLQVVLIGQPELRQRLAGRELEQLAQRVVARFHLGPLQEAETAQYVDHRLRIAGRQGESPFGAAALRQVHRLTRGVPRRINLLCDRALLGAYAQGATRVTAATVERAASEVFDGTPEAPRRFSFADRRPAVPLAAGMVVGVMVAVGAGLVWSWLSGTGTSVPSGTTAASRVGAGSGPLAAGPVAPLAAPQSLARQPEQPAKSQGAMPLVLPAGAEGTMARADGTLAKADGTLAGADGSQARANGSQARADGTLARVAGGMAALAEDSAEPSAVASAALKVAASAPSAGLTAFDGPLPLDSLFADETQALAALASLWPLQPLDKEPCASALRQQHQCYRSNRMTLDGLARLDRPAVMRLQLPGGRSGFALLTHRGTSQLRLSGRNMQWTLSQARLAALWRGDYVSLWRTPAGQSGHLANGYNASAAPWMEQRLNELQARGQLPSNLTSLRDKVEAFQRANGIEVNGRASPTTLILINRATGVDEPRLDRLPA